MLLQMVMLMGTTAFAAEPDFTGYTAISTKGELNAVRNDLSGKYYLTTDIVFTAENFAEGSAFYGGGTGWQSIGSKENPFTGIFDRNAYAGGTAENVYGDTIKFCIILTKALASEQMPEQNVQKKNCRRWRYSLALALSPFGL